MIGSMLKNSRGIWEGENRLDSRKTALWKDLEEPEAEAQVGGLLYGNTPPRPSKSHCRAEASNGTSSGNLGVGIAAVDCTGHHCAVSIEETNNWAVVGDYGDSPNDEAYSSTRTTRDV